MSWASMPGQKLRPAPVMAMTLILGSSPVSVNSRNNSISVATDHALCRSGRFRVNNPTPSDTCLVTI